VAQRPDGPRVVFVEHLMGERDAAMEDVAQEGGSAGGSAQPFQDRPGPTAVRQGVDEGGGGGIEPAVLVGECGAEVVVGGAADADAAPVGLFAALATDRDRCGDCPHTPRRPQVR
jgi:hypothetical protein